MGFAKTLYKRLFKIVATGGSSLGDGTEVLNDNFETIDDALESIETQISDIESESVSGHESEFDHTLLHTQNTDASLDSGGLSEVSASELRQHIDSTSNPHGVTAVQVGADPTGSSAAVASSLNTHKNDVSNPHNVTAAQVGAIDTGDKGVASGVASLDSSGKVPSTQLPAIAIADTFVVASEAAMLGLVAETGDVAVRTDESKSYILMGSDSSVLEDWQELLTPSGEVSSVFGRTGVISAAYGDYEAADVSYDNTDSSMTATDVKAAIDELASDLETHNHDSAYDAAGSASTVQSDLNTHKNDSDIHRSINDAGTALTDLWSASKISTDLNSKAAAAHTHDDRYYTETEVDDLIAGVSAGVPAEHTHTEADITDLGDYATSTELIDGLATKADASHTHTESEITDLGDYATSTELIDGLATKAATSHTHDDRYYTEVEVDDLIAGVSAGVPAEHTHDIADVTGLQDSLNSKAGSVHTHTEADITDLGDYATSTELTTGLEGKAATVHTHTEADITDLGDYATSSELTTGLLGKSDIGHNHDGTYDALGSASGVASNLTTHTSNVSNPHSVTAAQVGAIATGAKGAASGVASLDSSGKVPSTQLPAIAISDTSVVASEAAMLALVAETGDIAVRTDENKSYILAGTDPSIISHWQELLAPTGDVSSVFGRTGVVSAAYGDYEAADVSYDNTDSSMTATDVKAAIDELASDIATHDHDSAYDAAGSASTVQGNLDTHKNDSTIHRAINDAGTAATDLWSASKISSEISGKANTAHTHTEADITDLGDYATSAELTAGLSAKSGISHNHDGTYDTFGSAAAVASDLSTHTENTINPHSVTAAQVGAIPTSEKGAVSGVASLDSSGKVPSTQLPAIAINDTYVVASEIDMLALTATTGDVAVRTDESKSYILAGADPTILANWQELLAPDNTVASVFGRSGTVVATPGDYAASDITYDGSVSGVSGASTIQQAIDGLVVVITHFMNMTSVMTNLIMSHVGRYNNPHRVTAAQTGSVPTSDKGVAGGVATLDSVGKVPSDQLPAIAINDTYVVANQSEMLSLVATTGDVAIRTDESKSYILAGTNPSVLADWQELVSPLGAVTTVFGRSGAVSATYGDYSAGDILYDNAASGLAGNDVQSVLDELSSAAASDQTSRWVMLAPSSYTALPASTSRITMADTVNLAVGLPLRYTISGVVYYGLISSISPGNYVDIQGAPLSEEITKLELGGAEAVRQMSFYVGPDYGSSTGDKLASTMHVYTPWLMSQAYVVGLDAYHATADSTSQPTINLKVGGSAVSTAGLELSTAGTRVSNSAVAIDSDTYGVSSGDMFEVTVSTAGGSGDAAHLTVVATIISEMTAPEAPYGTFTYEDYCAWSSEEGYDVSGDGTGVWTLTIGDLWTGTKSGELGTEEGDTPVGSYTRTGGVSTAGFRTITIPDGAVELAPFGSEEVPQNVCNDTELPVYQTYYLNPIA